VVSASCVNGPVVTRCITVIHEAQEVGGVLRTFCICAGNVTDGRRTRVLSSQPLQQRISVVCVCDTETTQRQLRWCVMTEHNSNPLTTFLRRAAMNISTD
jgi:hypothetical protein